MTRVFDARLRWLVAAVLMGVTVVATGSYAALGDGDPASDTSWTVAAAINTFGVGSR